MKKALLFLFLTLSLSKYSAAQIICIFCYDRNDSISDNVNNLLLNGGFENGCLSGGSFCPNSVDYNCDITNWTCTGGGVLTYASTTFNGVHVEGTTSAYFGNSGGYPCSPTMSDTSCLGNIDCTVTGISVGFPFSDASYGGVTGISLEQTVTGLIIGNTYVLEFWAGGESVGFIKSGLFAVDIGFGNTFLRDKPTAPLGGIGTRFVIEFNATSSSHTIKFTNWGHICVDCTELVLDDVRLYTLAELSKSVPHCINKANELSDIQSAITLSPNPATNQFTITSGFAIKEIAICNVLGESVYSVTLSGVEARKQETVNANLTPGIYFVRVASQDFVSVKKLVVY